MKVEVRYATEFGSSATVINVTEIPSFAKRFKLLSVNPHKELSTKLHIGEIVDESYPEAFRKQETLEEVLGSSMCQFSIIENKLAILYRNQVKIYDAITKEQQSYSEEEVKDIMAETWIRCIGNDGNDFKELRDKILEQFKKK